MANPGIELEGSYRNTKNASNVDWWYGGGDAAWANLSTATTAIATNKRLGLTIGVYESEAIVEYWWPTQASITSDPIVKITNSGGGGGSFTEAQVRATPLTGLDLSNNIAITDTDTVLSGAGKLQAQINYLPDIAQSKVDDYDLFVHYDSGYFIYNGPDPNTTFAQNGGISLYAGDRGGGISLRKTAQGAKMMPNGFAQFSHTFLDYTGLKISNFNGQGTSSFEVSITVDEIPSTGTPIATAHFASGFSGSLLKFDNWQRLNVPANHATDDHDLITLGEVTALMSTGGGTGISAAEGLYDDGSGYFKLGAPYGSGANEFQEDREVNIGNHMLRIGNSDYYVALEGDNNTLYWHDSDYDLYSYIRLDNGGIHFSSFSDDGSVSAFNLLQSDNTGAQYYNVKGYGIDYYLPTLDTTKFNNGTLVHKKYVDDAIAASTSGVPTSRTLSINGTTYDLTANRSWTINKASVGLANVENISIVGAIATAISNLVDSSPATLDTLKEIADALGNDPNFATTIINSLATKAPINNPALTGNPTVPNQAPGDSSSKIANTKFVSDAILVSNNYKLSYNFYQSIL